MFSPPRPTFGLPSAAWLLVVFVLLQTFSWGQAVDANAGRRDFAFADILTPAQNMGFCDNQVAVAEGTDAIGVNPAGLSRTSAGRNLAATFQVFALGETGGQFTYVFGSTANRLALSAAFLNGGDIEMRNEEGLPLGTVSPTSFAPTLTYAFMANDGWRLGASLRAYQDYLGNFEGSTSAAGIGMDLGALYSPGAKNLGFGFAIHRLGRKFSSASADIDGDRFLTPLLKLGLFYLVSPSPEIGKLKLIAETQWDGAENPVVGAGLEWSAHPAFQVRTGIRASMQELMYAYRQYAEGMQRDLYGGEARRLGAGFTLNLGVVSLDYGVQWWTDLGFAHGLTLKHSWGN